jgi:hypothetical protein
MCRILAKQGAKAHFIGQTGSFIAQTKEREYARP